MQPGFNSRQPDMDNAVAISAVIIIVRLLTPFTILRWPVAGVLVNMLVDALDYPIAQYVGWGLFDNGRYQYIDKALDTWYLCFLLYTVVHQWTDQRAKRVATVLFFWRIAGFTLFMVTGWERLLILTPNVFEFFYLYWASAIKWFSKVTLTVRHLTIVVMVLTLLKIADEIRIHWFSMSFDIWKNILFPN